MFVVHSLKYMHLHFLQYKYNNNPIEKKSNFIIFNIIEIVPSTGD